MATHPDQWSGCASTHPISHPMCSLPPPMLSSKALGKRRAMDDEPDEPKAHAPKQPRKSPVGIECAWAPVSDELEAASLALAQRLQAEEDALAQREYERQARMQEQLRFRNSFDAYNLPAQVPPLPNDDVSLHDLFGEEIDGDPYEDGTYARPDDPAITNAMITDAFDDCDMGNDCEAYDPVTNATCQSKYFAPGKAAWYAETGRAPDPSDPLWTPPTERVMEVRYGQSSSAAASVCTMVEVEQPVRDASELGSQPTPVLFPPLVPVRPPAPGAPSSSSAPLALWVD